MEFKVRSMRSGSGAGGKLFEGGFVIGKFFEDHQQPLHLRLDRQAVQTAPDRRHLVEKCLSAREVLRARVPDFSMSIEG